MIETIGPNAQQIAYWNEQAGPRWVRLQELLDAQLAPLGEAAMDALGLADGERVLDVGCGCGDSTLAIARRVGASGSVTGVDISGVMLERARQRARDAGLTNVHFEIADAQTHRFAPGGFDALFSRFGVMFFTDPGVAFTNLRAALRPGGRLGFVCWQAMQDNPWLLEPLKVAAQHIVLPAPPAPDAPGPFAFADPERVRGILSGAGFTAVAVQDWSVQLTLGSSVDIAQVADFLMQMGPTATALRDADPEARQRVASAMHEMLVPYQTADGVQMPAKAWIATARQVAEG
jgi:SAM-dependent methyltransferase